MVDKDAEEDLEYVYENLVGDFEDSSYKTVNKFSVSNIEGVASQNNWYSEEKLVVQVELDYDYAVGYTRNWFDEVTNETSDDSNSCYISLAYKDGKWLIVEISGMYIYY